MIRDSASVDIHININCEKDALTGMFNINDAILTAISKLEKCDLRFYSISLNPDNELEDGLDEID